MPSALSLIARHEFYVLRLHFYIEQETLTIGLILLSLHVAFKFQTLVK